EGRCRACRPSQASMRLPECARCSLRCRCDLLISPRLDPFLHSDCRATAGSVSSELALFLSGSGGIDTSLTGLCCLRRDGTKEWTGCFGLGRGKGGQTS